MKRLLVISLSCLIALAVGATTPIRIVFDNDVHCELKGYISIAGVRDSLAARSDGQCTALVSAGDYLQGGTMGAISRGSYVVDVMNAVGYDAVTFGNHEFDYKKDRFVELAAAMTMPKTCCNLYDLATTPARRMAAPYVIKTFSDGRKVAFVGVLTPRAEDDECYAFYQDDMKVMDLCGDSLVQVVQAAIDAALAQSPDYVVLLSHMGEVVISGVMSSHQLVAQLSGLTAVLDGHTHTVQSGVWINDKSGHPVLVAQTGTKVANVGILTLGDSIYTEMIPSAQCPQSMAVKHVCDSIDAISAEELNRVVGHTDFPLTISDPATGARMVRQRETNLANVVTDAFAYALETPIAIVNGGGVRNNIPQGDITYGQIVDVSPFNNLMYELQCKGQDLLDILELGVASLPGEFGDFVHASGLHYAIDTTQHPVLSYTPEGVLQTTGTRRVHSVEVYSEHAWLPLYPDSSYVIAMSAYMAFDASKVFKQSIILRSMVTTDTQAVIDYLLDGLSGEVPVAYADPYGEGRIAFAPVPVTGLPSRRVDSAPACQKVLHNGAIYLLRDGKAYNLLGNFLH